MDGGNSSSSSFPSRPFSSFVRRCLQKRLRVELSDGRVVEGILQCYDDSGNMILSHTIDVSSRVNHLPGRQSYRMGTVLVPGKHQVNVKLYKGDRGAEEVAARLRDIRLKEVVAAEGVFQGKG